MGEISKKMALVGFCCLGGWPTFPKIASRKSIREPCLKQLDELPSQEFLGLSQHKGSTSAATGMKGAKKWAKT